MMRLVVSVPVWNTPSHLLNRSVESLLNQSGVDVMVVVTFDGPDQAEQHHLPPDPRVITHTLPINRGRYYCDAVVLESVLEHPDWWFTIQDADDYSDPDRFGKQIRQTIDEGNTASVGPYFVHTNGGPATVRKPNPRRLASPSPDMAHLVHWGSSVATVGRQYLAGGIAAQFRTNYDTLHTLMLQLTGPLTVTDTPGFHWCKRSSNSLTTSPSTRIGSPSRAEAKRAQQALWKQALTAERPGDVIRASIPVALKAQIIDDAHTLRPRVHAGCA